MEPEANISQIANTHVELDEKKIKNKASQLLKEYASELMDKSVSNAKRMDKVAKIAEIQTIAELLKS